MAITPTRSAPAALPPSTDLFERWHHHGDPRARDALIERFLPLARKLAARYIRSGEPYDDLVQVASLGLVKAVDRFDPTRGNAFTSYAVPTIVGELKRHFRDASWTLHVGRRAQERARAVGDARREISATTGRSPTVSDLAQYLEVETEDVLEGLQAASAYTALSLDAPASSAPSSDPPPAATRAETLGELDSHLGQVDERVTISAAAQHLPKLEREVLYLRFGADLSQTEIAERVGVSQMQISRILRRSLGRLRELIDQPA
jgi:RNA polymerase sigma-B factor